MTEFYWEYQGGGGQGQEDKELPEDCEKGQDEKEQEDDDDGGDGDDDGGNDYKDEYDSDW